MAISILLAIVAAGIQPAQSTLPRDLKFLAPLKPTISRHEPKEANVEEMMLRNALAQREKLLKRHMVSKEVLEALDSRIALLEERAREARSGRANGGDQVYRLVFQIPRDRVVSAMHSHLLKPISGSTFVLRSGTYGSISKTKDGCQMTVTEPLWRPAG